MNIKNEESSTEQYAIISYSHADTQQVKAELSAYDAQGICYWYDERMTGGAGYDTQFFEILDNKNCKGIIFFVSCTFMLSQPCAGEMEYFLNKYGAENPDKFCLFVLPEGFPHKNADTVYDYIDNFVEARNDAELSKKRRFLDAHINLFLKLNLEGKAIFAKLGNAECYAREYCGEGQLFSNAGIMFGHSRLENILFGSFPQRQMRKAGASDTGSAERLMDKSPAYYAPVEWMVLKDGGRSQTLLSSELLFSVDYLSLKYPFLKEGKTAPQYIKDYFLNYFRQDEGDKRVINKIRFLSAAELSALLRRYQRNPEKKSKVLMPDPTYFAQVSTRKSASAFWLAGDMENAGWVDSGTKALSDKPAGIELYYVRIVLETERAAEDNSQGVSGNV